MLTSEFAARNPRAVVEALEEAAGATWRKLQRQRKEIRDLQGAPRESWWITWYRYRKSRARHEAETLCLLLAIRGGEW